MLQLRVTASAILLFAFVANAPAVGDEPFRYPEAKHGRGELRYVNGVPVLLVQGAPAEIGEQIGALGLKPAVGLTKLVDQFIQANGWERLYPPSFKDGEHHAPAVPDSAPDRVGGGGEGVWLVQRPARICQYRPRLA